METKELKESVCEGLMEATSNTDLVGRLVLTLENLKHKFNQIE